MRRVLILCLTLLFMVFGAGYAMAQNYAVAINGSKPFASEVTIEVGQQITFDIYLENAPGQATSGGVWVNFKASTGNIAYVSAARALTDSSEGVPGPWHAFFGAVSNEPNGVGTLQIVVAQFGVSPDPDGDIIVGRVTLECTAPGDANISLRTIPFFGTWEPPANGWDDAAINATTPNPTLVVHQVEVCTDPADCDDGDLCTDDVCLDNVCSYEPVDCDDSDLCTTDSCDPVMGCINNPVDCNDSDLCTTDSCDPVTGCINDPIDCDDGESCTDDFCDVGTGCVNTPIADGTPCDDGAFCTAVDECTGGVCGGSGDPCIGELVCDEENDVCLGLTDTDDDGIPDDQDNCLNHPNGPTLGTCIHGTIGTTCTSNEECDKIGGDGFCSKNQEDNYPPGGNGIGDACECEGDFDRDGDVDGADITKFLEDFGRGQYSNPCPQ